MKESTDKIPDFDFTSFLNMVQEPIVILDKERKIIHFNDLFLKETKFKDKNLRDKPFIELLHPEDKEYVQTRFIEKENGNEVSNGFLTRLIDNGGVCRNIFMTSNLLIKQKELFGFCVTLKLSSSDDFELLSNKEVYIGNIDSDDFDSADYKIYVPQSFSGELSIPMTISYLSANNDVYEVVENLTMRVYTTQEAQSLGLIGKSSTTTIYVILVLVVVGYFVYKKRKSKKKK